MVLAYSTIFRLGGWFQWVWSGLKNFRDFLEYILAGRLQLSGRSFWFRGKLFFYCVDWYNRAWKNERSVEIPVVKELLSMIVKDGYRIGDVIEVGDTLRHYCCGFYGTRPWTVVDAFERGKGVINEDVLRYKPSEPARLVVSVSTIEHVGIDDGKSDPVYAIEAVMRMKTWLVAGGELVCTWESGYNENLDIMAEVLFDRVYYMMQMRDGHWEQVKRGEAKNGKLVGFGFYKRAA